MVFSADSPGSSLRALRPCLELLWTNMLSDTARTWPSTLTVLDRTTWHRGNEAWASVHDLDRMLRVTISGFKQQMPQVKQFVSARRWCYMISQSAMWHRWELDKISALTLSGLHMGSPKFVIDIACSQLIIAAWSFNDTKHMEQISHFCWLLNQGMI